MIVAIYAMNAELIKKTIVYGVVAET